MKILLFMVLVTAYLLAFLAWCFQKSPAAAGWMAGIIGMAFALGRIHAGLRFSKELAEIRAQVLRMKPHHPECGPLRIDEHGRCVTCGRDATKEA